MVVRLADKYSLRTTSILNLFNAPGTVSAWLKDPAGKACQHLSTDLIEHINDIWRQEVRELSDRYACTGTHENDVKASRKTSGIGNGTSSNRTKGIVGQNGKARAGA